MALQPSPRAVLVFMGAALIATVILSSFTVQPVALLMGLVVGRAAVLADGRAQQALRKRNDWLWNDTPRQL